MYCNKFFKTEEEAKAFKKSHGGALYKNIKGSHTRQAYRVEAMMAVQGGWLRSTETDTYPFCVAWNGKPLSGEKPSQLQKKPSILQTMREQGEKVQTEPEKKAPSGRDAER